MSAHKPILVTGSHRSGTTWVGRMLAEAPSLFYIHEPFSVTDAPSRGICNTQFKYWFTYITRNTEASFYKPIRNMIDLKYDFIGGLRTYRSRDRIRELRREYRSFLQHRQNHTKVLIKDPMAFFSAEWMVERFGMDAVMVIRHPAAFVSSIKKLGWQHPFSHFLEQPSLMSDHLAGFTNDIREYAAREHDLIDQAILLWRLIHFRMIQYRQAHPEWIFIRHEDLSLAPLEQFQRLYTCLRLEYTEQAQQVIKTFSNSANPSETDAPVGSEEILRRNSALSIWNWKKRLSTAEIKKIRREVEDISCAFYSDEDWRDDLSV